MAIVGKDLFSGTHQAILAHTPDIGNNWVGDSGTNLETYLGYLNLHTPFAVSHEVYYLNIADIADVYVQAKFGTLSGENKTPELVARYNPSTKECVSIKPSIQDKFYLIGDTTLEVDAVWAPNTVLKLSVIKSTARIYRNDVLLGRVKTSLKTGKVGWRIN